MLLWLLPTLLVTQHAFARLDFFEPNHLRLRHCMPLLTSVISGFNSVFGNLLREKETLFNIALRSDATIRLIIHKKTLVAKVRDHRRTFRLLN